MLKEQQFWKNKADLGESDRRINKYCLKILFSHSNSILIHWDLNIFTCPGGGIGRRAGLKHQWG